MPDVELWFLENAIDFLPHHSPQTMFEPELYNQSNVSFCQRQFWISHSLVNSNQSHKSTTYKELHRKKAQTDMGDKNRDVSGASSALKCSPSSLWLEDHRLAQRNLSEGASWPEGKGGSFPEPDSTKSLVWAFSCHKLNWYHYSKKIFFLFCI